MKKRSIVHCVLLLSLFASCKKDSLITSPNAILFTSENAVHFDTVFTSVGSVTQSFKIFNLNDQRLRLSNVQLMGGNESFFKMNVDGSPGTLFNNIDIEAGDSLYVFVSVSINPNAANLPFVVQDSILINYNGNNRYVQLDAYGQNAHFLNNASVTKDTVWNNTLPIVIVGGLTVNAARTLTINQGTKVYCHAGAGINVNGTLKVNGSNDSTQSVLFTGDRSDAPYNTFTDSWPGISFNASSIDNVLNYAIINNAYQGIVATGPAADNNAKVSLNQCIINNIYDAGITGFNSSINAVNCLISNCGNNNVNINAGGSYSFLQCTMASYSTANLQHKQPVLQISNADPAGKPYAMNAGFTNCIFYGDNGTVNDEISTTKQGSTPFSLSFLNDLYKGTDVPTVGTLTNCISGQDPLFVNIDTRNMIFDFHLQPSSPCIGKGMNAGVAIDLDGNPRNNLTHPPDIGCYQTQ